MTSALIGHTGFVGGNLYRQRPFSHLYNSANIDAIRGANHDLIVCAGAPGSKWKANAAPRDDWYSIRLMREAIRDAKTEHFVLISTIDVYHPTYGTADDAPVSTAGLSWYGKNRLILEEMLREQFGERLTVVRLPALFGPGLKKNALYDLMHGHETAKISASAAYQWYNLDWLWADILRTTRPVSLFATQPIGVAEIRDRFFPGVELGPVDSGAPFYDIATEPRFNHLSRWAVLRSMGEFIHAARNARGLQPAG